MKFHLKKFLLQVLPITGLGACSPANPEDRPNIMLIVLDDAGYNDFGFMGCKDLLTPNIDSLAKHGVIFTDAHVSATVSGPSRCGILTGRYQQRNGYECNLSDTLGMGLSEDTIADIFLRNGYNTACIGKWHQGNTPDYHPNRRGFEYFYGFISGSRSYFYRPARTDKPGLTSNLQFNGKQEQFDGYLTDVLADNASEYIGRCSKEDRPFMMYLAFNAVHTPMEATEQDLALFAGHPRQKLAAMTWAVDRAIGAVVNTLKDTGEYDNTLIFFLSDNGGAHNNQSCNYPLKGFKGNKYEGGHRIPFFISHGGRYTGTFNGLSSSLDILATAMDAADIDLNSTKNPIDGTSLLPYLKGEKTGDPHNMLFWRKEGMSAVRMGNWKYIAAKGGGERLYDLSGNCDESLDLYDDKPEIVMRMKDALKEWETKLVNPILWGEGIWNDVTKEIHSDLMNNRPIRYYTPGEYRHSILHRQ